MIMRNAEHHSTRSDHTIRATLLSIVTYRRLRGLQHANFLPEYPRLALIPAPAFSLNVITYILFSQPRRKGQDMSWRLNEGHRSRFANLISPSHKLYISPEEPQRLDVSNM